jgi:hypothetical protein
VRADPLPDTSDDLPRTSADVGGADFRRDTAARDVSEDLTRGGFEFGSSVVSGGLDVIGEGDTSDRAVLEGIGGTLAATPGAAATTGVNAAQAFTSITGAGARGGPGAALDQLTDVSADAFDATAGGLDRTFDINQRTSAGPFGGEITTPAITTEPGARQDLAVSLTAGALSVPAGFAAGAGARGAAARAPTSLDDIGRVARGRPRRDRVAGDGGFDVDEALEQETITVERMADEEVDTSIESIEDIPGVEVTSTSTRTSRDLEAQRIEGAARMFDDVDETTAAVDVDDLSPVERAEQRVPPAREFPDAEMRAREVEQLAERIRREQESIDAEVSGTTADVAGATAAAAGASADPGAAEATADSVTGAGTEQATAAASATGDDDGGSAQEATETVDPADDLTDVTASVPAAAAAGGREATADTRRDVTTTVGLGAVAAVDETATVTETTTQVEATTAAERAASVQDSVSVLDGDLLLDGDQDLIQDLDERTTTTATVPTPSPPPRRPRDLELPRPEFDQVDDSLPAFDSETFVEDIEFSAQGLTTVDQQLADRFGGLDEP